MNKINILTLLIGVALSTNAMADFDPKPGQGTHFPSFEESHTLRGGDTVFNPAPQKMEPLGPAGTQKLDVTAGNRDDQISSNKSLELAPPAIPDAAQQLAQGGTPGGSGETAGGNNDDDEKGTKGEKGGKGSAAEQAGGCTDTRGRCGDDISGE